MYFTNWLRLEKRQRRLALSVDEIPGLNTSAFIILMALPMKPIYFKKMSQRKKGKHESILES